METKTTPRFQNLTFFHFHMKSRARRSLTARRKRIRRLILHSFCKLHGKREKKSFLCVVSCRVFRAESEKERDLITCCLRVQFLEGVTAVGFEWIGRSASSRRGSVGAREEKGNPKVGRQAAWGAESRRIRKEVWWQLRVGALNRVEALRRYFERLSLYKYHVGPTLPSMESKGLIKKGWLGAQRACGMRALGGLGFSNS